MVAFVKQVIQNPLCEVWNHGYNHEDFTTFTLAQQVTLLSNARLNISALLGIPPVTHFVPPFNSWNSNTLTAMAQVGYNMISSEVDQDPAPISDF